MRELLFFWNERQDYEAYESHTVWSVAGRFTGGVYRNGRTYNACLRYNDMVDGEEVAETVLAWTECDGFAAGRRMIEDRIAVDERTKYYGFIVTVVSAA